MSNTVEVLKPTDMPATTAPSSAVTPLDMLNQAVTSGAGLDVIERLMALHERWDANQARKAFDEAIANAKAKIPPIARNATGHNSKKYADFSAIARVVDPIISEFGLSYRFRTTQTERISVTCVLSHKSGHSEETTLSGPADKTGNKNEIQAIGSTLTYLQRYSLVQALGLAAAHDDDGKGASDTGPVTDAQAKQIADLITATKSDIGNFLKWANAESISDIPASRFNDCIAILKAKQRKGTAS